MGGFKEFQRLAEQPGAEVDSIMQGVQRGIRVALNQEEVRLLGRIWPFWPPSAPPAPMWDCSEPCGAS